MPISEKKLLANRRNAAASTGPTSDSGKSRSARNAITHGIFCRDLLLGCEDKQAFDEHRLGMLRRLKPRDMLELQIAQQIIATSWTLHRIRSAEKDVYEEEIASTKDAAKNKQREKVERLIEKVEGLNRSVRQAKVNRASYEQDLQEAVKALKQAEIEYRELMGSSPVLDVGSVLFKLFGHNSPPALDRLHRYEQRQENSMHRAIKQLRELQKERPDNDEPNEFTQALLDEPEQREESNVQNEPTAEGNDGSENELATDGARMDTDGKRDERRENVENGFSEGRGCDVKGENVPSGAG